MLTDPHCLRCACDRHGGYIEYSLRHLHPDWDVLTQTYEIRSMTDDGRFIYHSDFQLFPLGSSIPASFAPYAPALKVQLWQAIFRVKRYYLSRDFFVENVFNISSVNTKTFILLLAQHTPKSLLSGNFVSLQQVLKDANRSEFHHLYPKAYLKSVGIQDDSKINVLVNFCFLSKTDNNQIGGVAPFQYRVKLPADTVELNKVLDGSLFSSSLFDDKFDEFVKQRSEKLADFASSLIA